MEVKVLKRRHSPSLESPQNDKQDPEGMMVAGSHDVSDSENGDEGSPTRRFPNSASVRSNLLLRFAVKLARGEPSQQDTTCEEKPGENEGGYGWAVRKSVVEVSKGVAAHIKSSFGRLFEMKSLLIHKLASMPGIPADTFEYARHSIESIVWEATHSAYGKTKEAMSRIRLKLVEVLPSLAPHETKKIMDDLEKEIADGTKATNEYSSRSEEIADGTKATNEYSSRSEEKPNKDGTVGISASAASAVMSTQPSGGVLGLMGSTDRFRLWTLFRSRL